MATIHPGATLTPNFREFLPDWLARQSWFPATAPPQLRPAGFFRLEDPVGKVGLETHLVSDGSDVYQLPMTYRDAEVPGAAAALIAVAEHSVLGTRWIYDAEHDPVWTTELTRTVRTEQPVHPSTGRGGPSVAASGQWLLGDDTATRIELIRKLVSGPIPTAAGLAGVLQGRWYPLGAEQPSAEGPLALLHRLD